MVFVEHFQVKFVFHDIWLNSILEQGGVYTAWLIKPVKCIRKATISTVLLSQRLYRIIAFSSSGNYNRGEKNSP